MSTELEFISLFKGQNDHTHSVIWLHGLGADGGDFEPVARMMEFPDTIGINFIFPHAEHMPITINAGMPFRAWYDIKGFDLTDREDHEGIQISHGKIQELIEMEHAKGISYENIFLAGFSQGGAMSLFTGLTLKSKLAGIIALSCYLPAREHFEKTRSDEASNTPILLVHGTFDPIVQLAWGKMSYETLKELEYPIEFHTFPIAHNVFNPEIELINDWIVNRISSN